MKEGNLSSLISVSETLVALPWENYEGMPRLGRQLEIFEQIFQDHDAPVHPLLVVTPIVQDKPQFHAVTGVGPLNRDDLRGTPLEEPGLMVDYLQKYVSGGQFDIPRLTNDDYFLADGYVLDSRKLNILWFQKGCNAGDLTRDL